MTVNLFFGNMVNLKFLQQPPDNISFGNNAQQFLVFAVHDSESAIAESLKYVHRLGQRLIGINRANVFAHLLGDLTILLTVGQPPDEIFNANNADQFVPIHDGRSGDALLAEDCP